MSRGDGKLWESDHTSQKNHSYRILEAEPEKGWGVDKEKSSTLTHSDNSLLSHTLSFLFLFLFLALILFLFMCFLCHMKTNKEKQNVSKKQERESVRGKEDIAMLHSPYL